MTRQINKSILTVLAMLLGLTFAGNIFAQSTLLIENFDYPAGSALTANGWTAHNGGGTNVITATSPGLTLTGYPSSGIGNAASFTTTGEDVNRTFATQSAGNVYAAFMVNFSDASTDAIGGYFFHFGPDPVGTSFRGRIFARKDASNKLSFGITKASSSTATDIAYTPFVYDLNTTYLMVIKYSIVDGVTNDTVSLYVGTTVPANEPAATVTAPDTIASDINPGTVSIRQGTATTHPTARIDGIRVGTTWAGVTQAATLPSQNVVDFNGDGKTDYAVGRNVGGQLTWFIQTNGGSAYQVPWGLPTDKAVPEDFDGDKKTDIAVWRETGNAQVGRSYFYILRSSDSAFQSVMFGTTGDNPAIVGDYDGDGKADVAVFRPVYSAAVLPCGATDSIWFYRPSSNATVDFNYQCWGKSGDNPAPGDFNGDGKNDFAVQQNASGQAVFAIKFNGGASEFVNWGLSTDVFIPGDYDADGKTDICVRRTVSGAYHHFILYRTGTSSGASPIIWGLTGDVSTPGDYDGDGKTDIAVWRANSDPAMNYFFVRQSSNSALSITEWGQQGDTPVAAFQVR